MASQCSTFSKHFFPLLKNVLSASRSVVYKQPDAKQQSLRYRSIRAQQEVVTDDISKIEVKESAKVFDKVNEQIVKKTHSRLFAVVYLVGHQYKITTEDVLVVRQSWPPTNGDKIRLEKVMLVGSSDFTLIGRPILPLDQVTVLATVIEKTHTHPYPLFRFKPRSNYMKLIFLKDDVTYLRITDIIINGKVNEMGDIDGIRDRVF